MKKLLFLLSLMLVSSVCFAQNDNVATSQKSDDECTQVAGHQCGNQYYLYCIVSFDMEQDKKIKVDVDNGIEIKRLKNSKGDIKFKTRAAVIMYFVDKGWELVSLSSSTEISGKSGRVDSETNGFCLFKKPCTKDEFDNVVKQGIKK